MKPIGAAAPIFIPFKLLATTPHKPHKRGWKSTIRSLKRNGGPGGLATGCIKIPHSQRRPNLIFLFGGTRWDISGPQRPQRGKERKDFPAS